MKAQIRVMLKPGVLDTQGKAIGHALNGLGFDAVTAVRQGKVIEVELATEDRAQAQAQAEEMCRRLLANPVMETYSVELVG
jgi:phosphoribosylformylglycinamidine synthase